MAQEAEEPAADSMVVVERHGGVVWVRLNRPDKLNAQTVAMWAELADIGATLTADDTVRVAVVTGAGRSFSAGIDLGDLASKIGPAATDTESARIGEWAQAATAWLAEAPFPTVAAIRGHAYGAGLQLALAADLRIATPTARFAAMEAKYNLIPDMGGVEWLPRLVGHAKASEMIFLPDPIDAAEAHRIGLVTTLVDDADLETKTTEMAERLTNTAPLALREAKALLRQNFTQPGTAISASLEAQGRLIRSADFAEAVAALVENRPPAFTAS